jgi:site-specific DNA-methyltransferase (adenine-specific)
MVSAIEDAGFEIRDMINYTYGSGFPKNHDIGKAIEAKLKTGKSNSRSLRKVEQDGNGEPYELKGRNNGIMGEERTYERKTFTPDTDEAKQWQGFGTALKPSHEPIVLARKPVEGTIADNVLTYGTGAINIDGSRVPYEDTPNPATNPKYRQENDYKVPVGGQESEGAVKFTSGKNGINTEGRYPANTILAADEEVTALFPNSKSSPNKWEGENNANIYGKYKKGIRQSTYGDEGSAARFFQQIEYDPIIYQAKASKKERNKGLDHLPDQPSEHNSGGIGRKVSVEKRLDKEGQNAPTMKNTHPTVKPIKLMEYLVKLITPPGGVVLDPFAGSGTTLIAAKTQGFNYIGIELTPEYVEIAEARLKAY